MVCVYIRPKIKVDTSDIYIYLSIYSPFSSSFFSNYELGSCSPYKTVSHHHKIYKFSIVFKFISCIFWYRISQDVEIKMAKNGEKCEKPQKNHFKKPSYFVTRTENPPRDYEFSEAGRNWVKFRVHVTFYILREN